MWAVHRSPKGAWGHVCDCRSVCSCSEPCRESLLISPPCLYSEIIDLVVIMESSLKSFGLSSLAVDLFENLSKVKFPAWPLRESLVHRR